MDFYNYRVEVWFLMNLDSVFYIMISSSSSSKYKIINFFKIKCVLIFIGEILFGEIKMKVLKMF